MLCVTPLDQKKKGTNMAEKMPSFKHGGAYWFVDLTTPDPLRIFPVLTALSFLVLVEFKYMQRRNEGNPLHGIERQVCRGLVVLTVPFTLGFAKGIFCFWVTSNLFSLMRGIGGWRIHCTSILAYSCQMSSSLLYMHDDPRRCITT